MSRIPRSAPLVATGLIVVALVAIPPAARAQVRWTADRVHSLAWWQINPHLGHLWGTTCPEEPSWKPGEGHGGGWLFGGGFTPKHGNAGVNDTTIVPLYPRYEIGMPCTEAVQGEVLVADTVGWKGVSGHVTVRADAVIMGEKRRDAFTRETILEAMKYPLIRFDMDSLVSVSREADTLLGTAVGRFTLRHVVRPMTARVRAWPEAGGLRVVARMRVPAAELTEVYGLSKFGLGLGVTNRVWYDLFMGVDVLLRAP